MTVERTAGGSVRTKRETIADEVRGLCVENGIMKVEVEEEEAGVVDRWR